MIETLELPTPDGRRRRALLAKPEGQGPWPGVVVLHDVTGLRGDTRRHCENFAAAGYAALAPDLFDGYSPICVTRTLLSMVQSRGAVLPVIEAARAALAATPGVNPRQLCVTGFCMGGGFALLAAADGAWAVAAPFYGMVPRSRERLQGVCPTIAQFGARDVPYRGAPGRLAEHLEALGVPHEILVHPDAGHSFMNDHPDPLFGLARFTPLRAQHHAPTEAAAWRSLLAFFEAHLSSD